MNVLGEILLTCGRIAVRADCVDCVDSVVMAGSLLRLWQEPAPARLLWQVW